MSNNNNATTSIDSTLPWGIYIPPNGKDNHHGCVQVIDRKGKSFPCGFSQSMVMMRSEVVEIGVKRSYDDLSNEEVERRGKDTNAGTALLESAKTDNEFNNVSVVVEECLHPEEALFLHTRGLMRIESFPTKNVNCREPRIHATISTQELINNMLPECYISLTAYLAYAHLREQGYILMRYSTDRLSLLVRMISSSQKYNIRQAQGSLSEQNESPQKVTTNNLSIPDQQQHVNGVNQLDKKEKSAKQLYREDVANAPPPCISCNALKLEEQNVKCLAYLAYNPNAQFRRTNPGMPDFGVAIMPYHSHGERGPTVDSIFSLMSLCKSDDFDFPLRVMTVSDGGSVIAFGVTDGDVPSLN